jgi:hypothetical protein
MKEGKFSGARMSVATTRPKASLTAMGSILTSVLRCEFNLSRASSGVTNLRNSGIIVPYGSIIVIVVSLSNIGIEIMSA